MEAYRQPSERDIADLLEEGSGTLRAVRDTRTGDLFVWDAEEALHEEGLRYLGLTEFGENMGQIHSLNDFKWLTQRIGP